MSLPASTSHVASRNDCGANACVPHPNALKLHVREQLAHCAADLGIAANEMTGINLSREMLANETALP